MIQSQQYKIELGRLKLYIKKPIKIVKYKINKPKSFL